MDPPVRVLLISRSLRDGSTNTAVLKTAEQVTGDQIETTLYGDMARLPHFNPDDDREGEPADPLSPSCGQRSWRRMHCWCARPSTPARCRAL